MKSKLVYMVAAAVVVIGSGVFVVSRNSNSGNNSSSSKVAESSEQHSHDESEAEQGNIFSIASQDHAHKCTFQYSGEQGAGTGTMYADGKGQGRMDLSVKTSEGKTGAVHTLVVSDDIYGWAEFEGSAEAGVTGYKYKKSAIDTTSTGNANVSEAKKDYTLKCESWNVDSSMFTIPSGINFYELSL